MCDRFVKALFDCDGSIPLSHTNYGFKRGEEAIFTAETVAQRNGTITTEHWPKSCLAFFVSFDRSSLAAFRCRSCRRSMFIIHRMGMYIRRVICTVLYSSAVHNVQKRKSNLRVGSTRMIPAYHFVGLELHLRL